MKGYLVLLLVFVFAVSCNNNPDPAEQLKAEMEQWEKEREKVYAEREKLFSGEVSLDVGKVSYEKRTGKHISGMNPYKEFAKFIKENPKSAKLEMKFTLSFRGKDKQVITVEYDRVRTFAYVSSSAGGSNVKSFDTEEKLIHWADELAGYNSSLWLGLD